MPVLITDDVHLDIPVWVTSLATFRRWTDEPDFPEKGNIWWLRGEVWADMSQEQIFSHIDVKGEIYFAIKSLLRENDIGRIFTDGLLLTNDAAGLSGNPDASFFTHEARLEGRVVLIEGRIDGFTEVQGSPEMVLEVVSDGSIEKDLEILREDYFTAGVQEYWLVDARSSPPKFDILRRNSKAFVTTKKVSGWVKSSVFGRSFRLTEGKDRSGDPKFTLESK